MSQNTSLRRSERRWVAEQMIRDPRFRIYYLVPHPPQNLTDASPVQFYTPGILNTAPIFETLAQWPGDIREWGGEPEYTLHLRVLGLLDRRVMPIELPSFDEYTKQFDMAPFNCVVSTRETADSIKQIVSVAKTTWLHVSTEKIVGATFIGDVTPEFLRDFCRGALSAYLERHPDQNFEAYAREILDADIDRTRVALNRPYHGSGVTRSNEIALESFGFEFTEHAPLNPSHPDSYVEASISSAKLVALSRERLLSGKNVNTANSFILTASSPAWTSRNQVLDVRKLKGIEGGHTLQSIWKELLNQDRHTGMLSPESLEAMLKDPLTQAVVRLRQQEAFAYVASLTSHASHDLTPVLRLEPRVNRIRHQLIDIGNCARGFGPHRNFKVRKLLIRMSQTITSLIDAGYLQVLRRSSQRIEGLSIVSDLPLEFVLDDELPLALTYDCSRIPVNPGNASFGELLGHATVTIAQSDFSNVLVVRSFAKSDRLRGVLEMTVRNYGKRTERMPNVTFVDVSTPAEFVSAVNSFKGAVMVFDGHGVRNTEHHTGTIVVGGEEMDCWAYRREMNLPPIVLLSACDTLPLDGSHGAIATGLLAAGARTAVGTLLPISGIRGALFVGRLLFRIAEFLPQAALMHDRPLEWRGFLSGLLRMSHVSEVALDAAERFNLHEDVFREFQLGANLAINSRRPDWPEIVSQSMRSKLPKAVWTGLPISNPLAMPTEALLYVQAGHPELIQIVSDRRVGMRTAQESNQAQIRPQPG